MIKITQLLALAFCAQAAIQNRCQRGSDVECQAYGKDICCAQITYTGMEGVREE